MTFKERQLTFGAEGHTINNTQIFSPDNRWIVFDTRNDDAGIMRTGSIEMVSVKTGETVLLYHTENQTDYGPGVGAASFSPVSNRVLFIQGIRNATKEHPYDYTRRTGVAVDVDKPMHPIYMDARNIIAPYTAGALRGGTHAHSWSGDGWRISCTYNDYVLQQLSKTDSAVKDLRTVAVMMPGTVHVPANGMENNDGEMFAAVIASVTPTPAPGTDDIEKAFDETWIGRNGYQRTDGSRQQYAVAFQGNVRDEHDQVKTEVFVADIPENITAASAAGFLQGTDSTLPAPPAGVTQRRITHLKGGVQGPRHWLRSTADGRLIAFLAKDSNGIVQVFGVSPNGGALRQLTFNNFSIQTSFNFSPDDRYLAYIADNSVFITDLHENKTSRLTKRSSDAEAPVNGVVWSHDGKALAYNRYISGSSGRYLQIFLLERFKQ